MCSTVTLLFAAHAFTSLSLVLFSTFLPPIRIYNQFCRSQIVSHETITAINILITNELLQVTSNSVRLVSSTSRELLHEWFAPAGFSVNVATANATQVEHDNIPLLCFLSLLQRLLSLLSCLIISLLFCKTVVAFTMEKR